MALLKFRKMKYEDYFNLANKDSNTKYVVTGSNNEFVGEFIGNKLASPGSAAIPKINGELKINIDAGKMLFVRSTGKTVPEPYQQDYNFYYEVDSFVIDLGMLSHEFGATGQTLWMKVGYMQNTGETNTISVYVESLAKGYKINLPAGWNAYFI